MPHHFIITGYHEGTLTSVHHFQSNTPNATLIHKYIQATVDPGSMMTERIGPRLARRLPVDWLTVPAEFGQALARIAATQEG